MTTGQFQTALLFLSPSKLIQTYDEINFFTSSQKVTIECGICSNHFERSIADLITFNKNNNNKCNICNPCKRRHSNRLFYYSQYWINKNYTKEFENYRGFSDFIFSDNNRETKFECRTCQNIFTVTHQDFIERMKRDKNNCRECNAGIKGLKISEAKSGDNFDIINKGYPVVCKICKCTEFFTKQKYFKKNDNYTHIQCASKLRKERIKFKRTLKQSNKYSLGRKLLAFKAFKNKLKSQKIIKIFSNTSEFGKKYNIRSRFFALSNCKCGNKTLVTIKGKIECMCCSSTKSLLTIDEIKTLNFGVISELEYLTPSDKIIEVRCACGNCYKKKASFKQKYKCLKCKRFKSHGEASVEKTLQNLNIEYITEKSFPNLLSEKGYRLRYDFYLEEFNLLIEYDGAQHYNGVIFNSKTKESDLQTTQLRDKMKDEYCQKNNINLLRIPYWEFKNIDVIINRTIYNLRTGNEITNW